MNPEHQELVEKVVRHVVAKYGYNGLSEEDLVQEGMLALLKAEKTYQAEKGAKFETYASTVIRNHLIDTIRVHSYIDSQEGTEPPVQPDPTEDIFEVLRKVLNQCNDLEQKIFMAKVQGYSYQEICEQCAVTKKKVDNTIQKIRKLYRTIDEDYV